MKTALLLAVAAMAATAQAGQVEDILGQISQQRIEANIRKLASFGTRNSLSDPDHPTRGIGAARRWIHDEMKRCGGDRLQVTFDEHLIESGPRVPKPTKFVNVVATLPGTQAESRDRVYVVSGHYDSMPSSPVDPEKDAPGANDDASGTAVSMELACVMSKFRFDATLVFMAVAGEEQGLLGATGFAKAAKAKGMNIAGMITNDIVGNSRAPDGTVDRSRLRLFAEGVPANKTLPDDVVAALRTSGENDLPTRQLARRIKEIADAHVKSPKVEVIWRRDRFLRGGDHFPFLEQGYAAVRFTEPVEDWRHQHQDVRMVDGVQYGDLPDFVDFAYVAGVARVNAATLAVLAMAPAAPRNVEMENLRLEQDTTLRWEASPEPDVAGYRIVWRDTTMPTWSQSKDVGNTLRHTLVGVSKDNFTFGVQAYDKDGNVSVAAYPKPYRPAAGAPPPAPGTTGAANAKYDPDLAKATGANDQGLRGYTFVLLKTGPNRVPDGPERNAMFAGHFANIQRLAGEGKLAYAGPMDGVDGWRGLFILATTDLEEAKKLVATDPVIMKGEMVAEYHKHFGSAALMLVNKHHEQVKKQ